MKNASTAGAITGIHSEYWLGYKQAVVNASYFSTDGAIQLPHRYPSNASPFSHWCVCVYGGATCWLPGYCMAWLPQH